MVCHFSRFAGSCMAQNKAIKLSVLWQLLLRQFWFWSFEHGLQLPRNYYWTSGHETVDEFTTGSPIPLPVKGVPTFFLQASITWSFDFGQRPNERFEDCKRPPPIDKCTTIYDLLCESLYSFKVIGCDLKYHWWITPNRFPRKVETSVFLNYPDAFSSRTHKV